jgi:hypothetical protein
VLGCELRALEPVSKIGDVLGLNRSTAFRLAESDDWPMVGGRGSRRVIVPALAARLGLSVQIMPDESGELR